MLDCSINNCTPKTSKFLGSRSIGQCKAPGLNKANTPESINIPLKKFASEKSFHDFQVKYLLKFNYSSKTKEHPHNFGRSINNNVITEKPIALLTLRRTRDIYFLLLILSFSNGTDWGISETIMLLLRRPEFSKRKSTLLFSILLIN